MHAIARKYATFNIGKEGCEEGRKEGRKRDYKAHEDDGCGIPIITKLSTLFYCKFESR
jgi:hypothetical protein